MIGLVIGHSETDSGACNQSYDICEFEFNKMLVNDIHSKLNVPSIPIYRTEYKKLPQDINIIKPLFVVSFHCNAFNKITSGTETLYYHTSKKGKIIAAKLQTELVDLLELNDRGIKPRTKDDRGGYLLTYTKCPAVIIEPFFIDNDNDYERAIERYDYLIDRIKTALEDLYEEIKA